MRSTINKDGQIKGAEIPCNYFEFKSLLSKSGGKNDLRSLCSQIVADFDRDYLSKKRTAKQKEQEYLESTKK